MKLVASPPKGKIKLGPACDEITAAVSVRLKSKKAYAAGRFCADVKPVQTNADGIVFAMYTASRNPGDDCRVENWDELDLEWLAKDGTLETNVWHNMGKEKNSIMTNENHEKHTEGIPKEWARYCIEWTKDGSVKFEVDGKELKRSKTSSIGKPWKPMYGYFSIWGGDIPSWSGSVVGMKEDAFGFIRNVTFEEAK